jgi:hypothetical protein
MRRAELNANVAVAQYAGQADQAAARNRESFVSAVKLCNTDFKDDAVPVKVEPSK